MDLGRIPRYVIKCRMSVHYGCAGLCCSLGEELCKLGKLVWVWVNLKWEFLDIMRNFLILLYRICKYIDYLLYSVPMGVGAWAKSFCGPGKVV